MNVYEQKQQLRRARLEDRADRLQREGAAAIDSGMTRLRAIPFGQPILVGHHSERRDRNYRRKAVGAVDRGIALQKEGAEASARAAAVGTGGISSDDPDAVKKLKHQLAELERKQADMVKTNALVRKKDIAGLLAMGHHATTVNRWVGSPIYGDKFAAYTYELSNNSANIRRIKERIKYLTKAAIRETKSEELPGGIKLIENAEANRVQLIFPGKPSSEVRGKLKAAGFRWSPTEGAWQRHLNSSAVYWARDLVSKLTKDAS